MFKTSKIIAIISFLIGPIIVLILPAYKNYIIALMEISAELWLLVELIIFFKKKKLALDEYSICLSIIFVFLADIFNAFHILKITDNFAFISDSLYSFYAFFLLIYLVKKLNIVERELKEWAWISLIALIIDGSISFWFLLYPYYQTDAPLPWKISGTTYAILTILIFALIAPFAFRAADRKTFWFLNLIIMLLASDFAIRYQDAFINTNIFSWAEAGWYSAFIGFGWLVHFSPNKKEPFISDNLDLAPFISIRSLLTLSICSANNLLLIGILSFKLYTLKTGSDISSVFLLVFIFWTIANEFSIWLATDLSLTLKNMFKSKENLSSDGIVQFNLEQVTSKNYIFEIAKILESYNDLVKQTNLIMNVVTETNKKATLAEIAFQVSHDIRSPLAALDMVTKTMPELPEKSRLLIRSSISRIKDITNNLIQKNPKILNYKNRKTKDENDNETQSIQLLSSLIDRLISEKRMQFRSKIGIEIDSTLDENSYGIFSQVNVREFMRILSNLINNAVEALSNKGRVIVSLTQKENNAVVSIEDNGHGMTNEILNKIGSLGITFGKKNGSGRGLYHAITTIESWGGSLKINSTPSIGTNVNIKLPLAEAAPWFVKNLYIPANSFIVILDDDISIHQIWSGRFDKINMKTKNIDISHLSTPEQLIQWFRKNENIITKTLFLIDYEFLNYDKSGINVVEELGIESQSILVTSHYEEINLRIECERLGIQLIPKEIAAFVPITVEDSETDTIGQRAPIS